MKTMRLFPLELKRLLQSRLTWLMMALTVLSPVLGLVLYKPATSTTMLSMYLANPAITGGVAGAILFGLLAIFELDRARRSRTDVLTDAAVSPHAMALVRLLALLTAAVLVFCDPLVRLFGAPKDAFLYARSYLFVYGCGSLFVMFSLGLNPFITAQGFSVTSMLTVAIGAVLNVALDPIFIFVLNMGVEGAALATILSQAVSAAWVIWFLCGKRTVLRLRLRFMAPRPKLLLPCLALGVSPFIMQATEAAINVCFNRQLALYGGALAVSAMTILASVMQFAMLPLQGLTQGAQPITSYNYGAKNAARVRASFRALLAACMIYAGALWLAVMLFPHGFAALFSTDEALIDFTARALRVYMAVGVLFGVQLACQQTFIALGNAKSSLFLAVLRKIVLRIPLIYLLPAILPMDKTMAVYLAEPVADFLAVTATALLFAHQFPRALRALETDECTKT